MPLLPQRSTRFYSCLERFGYCSQLYESHVFPPSFPLTCQRRMFPLRKLRQA